MKSTKILYWVFTGIFAALMLFASYGSILKLPEAVDLIHDKMGYPTFMVAFTGWAKVLGVIGILIPGMPRVKEWAYAGLMFDLAAVIYSFIALGYPVSAWGMMLVWVVFGILSYVYYHKFQRQKSLAVAR